MYSTTDYSHSKQASKPDLASQNTVKEMGKNSKTQEYSLLLMHAGHAVCKAADGSHPKQASKPNLHLMKASAQH